MPLISKPFEPRTIIVRLYTPWPEKSSPQRQAFKGEEIPTPMVQRSANVFAFTVWAGAPVYVRLHRMMSPLQIGWLQDIDKPIVEVPFFAGAVPEWLVAIDFGSYVALSLPIEREENRLKDVLYVNNDATSNAELMESRTRLLETRHVVFINHPKPHGTPTEEGHFSLAA